MAILLGAVAHVRKAEAEDLPLAAKDPDQSFVRSDAWAVVGDAADVAIGLDEDAELDKDPMRMELMPAEDDVDGWVSLADLGAGAAAGQEQALEQDVGVGKKLLKLWLGCTNLPNQFGDKIDPYLVLTGGPASSPPGPEWTRETAKLANKPNPVWQDPVIVPYDFTKLEPVTGKLMDEDTLSKNDHIADFSFTLGEVYFNLRDGTPQNINLYKKGQQVMYRGEPSFCTVRKAMVPVDETLKIKFFGSTLAKKDNYIIAGTSDPYIKIYLDQNADPIIRTETIPHNVNPVWKPTSVKVEHIGNGNWYTDLFMQVYDKDTISADDLIGECWFKAHLLLAPGAKGEICTLLKEGKDGSQGEIGVQDVIGERPMEIGDYLSAGVELDFTVAVDLTASNSENGFDGNGLHDGGANSQYGVAIRKLGAVIEQYDNDKQYDLYTFGGLTDVDHAYTSGFLEGRPALDDANKVDVDQWSRGISEGVENFRVEVQDMKSEKGKLLEGKTGLLQDYKADSGRFTVDLEQVGLKDMKPENLKYLPAPASAKVKYHQTPCESTDGGTTPTGRICAESCPKLWSETDAGVEHGFACKTGFFKQWTGKLARPTQKVCCELIQQTYKKGDKVEIFGVNSNKALNRQVGTVDRWDADRERYLVELPGHKAAMAFRIGNLRPKLSNRAPLKTGVEALSASYVNLVDWCRLSVTVPARGRIPKTQGCFYGPTSYSEVIRAAVRDNVADSQGGNKAYKVLVVLTDGTPHADDMVATQLALTEAAEHPISIVLVGIGTGDGGTGFRALEVLDGDKGYAGWPTAKGQRQAGPKRDVVQHVDYPEKDPSLLAHMTLEEIPKQLIDAYVGKPIPRITYAEIAGTVHELPLVVRGKPDYLGVTTYVQNRHSAGIRRG